MKLLANRIMVHRATSLFARVQAHLPDSGTIADIGSGTGHNADEIRRRTPLAVREFDVADLHWIGPGPSILDCSRIPVDDGEFKGVLMFFVLQYPDSAKQLLTEARRISQGPVIVVQSVYDGWRGRAVLGLREFIWGRLALWVATRVGAVRPVKCPLRPRRYFTRIELQALFESAGLALATREEAKWPGLGVSRDLYVLKPKHP